MAQDKMDIKKGWLNPYEYNKYGFFDSDYEEPTFLTFKLEFGNWGASMNSDSEDRLIWESNKINYQSYDDMPMALFDPNYTKPNYHGTPNYSNFSAITSYSAVDYLYRINEDVRAEYLATFIKGWYELQKKYQYYFQEVSGLANLFKVDTTKGMRLSKDTKVTITCLEEALDQKVKYLLSLYKKAAWDDVYQRWILPDICRYFHMYIYISEARLFHCHSNNSRRNTEILAEYSTMVAASTASTSSTTTLSESSETGLVLLKALDGFAPVTVIDCGPCEFDISDLGSYQDAYGINAPSQPNEKTKFSVIVKNCKFYHKNPLMSKLNSGNDSSIGGRVDLQFIKDLASAKERTSYDVLKTNFNTYMSQEFFNNDVLLNISNSEPDKWVGGIDAVALKRSGSDSQMNGANLSRENVGPAISSVELMEYLGNNPMVSLWEEIVKYIPYSAATSDFGYWEMAGYLWHNTLDVLLNTRPIDDHLHANFRLGESIAMFESGEYRQQLEDYYKWHIFLNQALKRNTIVQDEIYNSTGGDRSLATDLDGGPGDIGINVEGDDPVIINSALIPVDTEKTDDRSWATDLDGWRSGSDADKDQMVKIDRTSEPVEQALVSLDTSTASLQQELVALDNSAEISNNFNGVALESTTDRSWATELDGWRSTNDSDKDKMPSINTQSSVTRQELVSLSTETSIDTVLQDVEVKEDPLKLEHDMVENKGKGITVVANMVEIPIPSGIGDNATMVENVAGDEYEPNSEMVANFPEESMRPTGFMPIKPNEFTVSPLTVSKGLVPNVINGSFNSSVGTNMVSNGISVEASEPMQMIANALDSDYEVQEINGPFIDNKIDYEIGSQMVPNNAYSEETQRLEIKSEKEPEVEYIAPEIKDDGMLDAVERAKQSNMPEPSSLNIEQPRQDAPKLLDLGIEETQYSKPEIQNDSNGIAESYSKPSMQAVKLLETDEVPKASKLSLVGNYVVKEAPTKMTLVDNPTTVESTPKMELVQNDMDPEFKHSKAFVSNHVEKEPSKFMAMQENIFNEDFDKMSLKDKIAKTTPKAEKASKPKRDSMQSIDIPKMSTSNLLASITKLKKENAKLIKEAEKYKSALKKMKMQAVPQTIDRSWATDLDGWNAGEDSDKDSMVANKPTKKNRKLTVTEPKIVL